MSRPNAATSEVEIDVLSSQPRTNPATHRGVGAQAQIRVNNPNVRYSGDFIESRFQYEKNHVELSGAGSSGEDGAAAGSAESITITPQTHEYSFRTRRHVPRVGVMLVGWGGNNGSTVTAAIHANKHNITWNRKDGVQKPNYYGSLTQATTIRVGSNAAGKEVHIPFSRILPMLNPNELVIGGWDINNANIAEACQRGEVLDWDLQRQLAPALSQLVPLPSIYYPDFIAANQSDRANNVIPGTDKQAHLEHLRADIRRFKQQNRLDTVVVLWTANTERFTDVRPGLNLTADEVLASIRRSDDEVSPSNVFAAASILEGCAYINGSPQNTLVPGVVDLAKRHKVFVGGDDFKSGQTKMKSVLVDFLVSAGLKPASIVSYNHLGNNDGKNLSAPSQFRSKEISKSNVVDDMVASNHLLYGPNEHPDHCVVIKYVPFVADSKRAMDEYTSVIFMNGLSTIAMHNVCEDSLLAAPLIIDLVVLTELLTRIEYRTPDLPEGQWERFHPVLSILSYLLKAPAVPEGTPVVNALMKQHRMITNILSAAAGLALDSDMMLEHKTLLPRPSPVRARL